MMRCVLFLLLITQTSALSNSSLIAAFTEVFNVHDLIADATILNTALRELEKMGVSANGLRDLPEDQAALILMKASLAEFLIGLQDDKDWSVVMMGTGHLVRERSFSAVRFAVFECLLVISVVALGWSVWTNKVPT